MTDPTPNFPEYHTPIPNPKGVRVTDTTQSKLLMRAIKVVGKIRMPRKKGLISRDQVKIKHRTPKFW